MPELPEVENFRRYFERHAVGRVVEKVEVRDRRVLGSKSERAFRTALPGAEFVATRRHGKHLFVATDREQWIRFHFGMTGDLMAYRPVDEEPRFARVVFHFTDRSRLAFDDSRLFGRIEIIDTPEQYIVRKKLGCDPLDPTLTITHFRETLLARRGTLKATLMSQEVVAGLGNLYVDELLYQTNLHPRLPIERLTPVDVRNLFTRMRRILERVIELHDLGRDYPKAFLITHRGETTKCPKCGGALVRATVAGRTTYWCEAHQKM